MPTWQPNWNDVVFDHAKASAAAEALRALAALVDRHADQRARLAEWARHEWRGSARETFDDELARLLRRAADLAEALRAAARHIDAAGEQARLEQRRRVDARRRWQEELRREEAAAPPAPVATGPAMRGNRAI